MVRRREGLSGRSRSRDSGRDKERGGRKGRFVYQRRSEESVSHRQEKQEGSRETIIKIDCEKFSPQKGDNCVRILPPTWDDAEHFGFDVYIHYNIGPDNSEYLCPRAMKTDTHCPICEEKANAESSGDEDYAKSLRVSHRTLYWVVDRDDESKGVKLWSAPFHSIDKELTAMLRDSRSGEVLFIDDPEEGYDVLFSKEGEKDRTRYSGLQISRHASDLGDGADEWLEFASDNPLPDIVKTVSPEYIEDIFSAKPSRSPGRRDEKEDKSEITYNEVQEMDFDDLVQVVDDERLDIDPEDYPEDEELADAVCEELGLKPERKERSSSRSDRKKMDRIGKRGR